MTADLHNFPKIIPPGSYDFGAAPVSLIKASSRGLLGGYDYSVLTKRAGAEFAHHVRNLVLPDDEVPAHMMAMGATDFFGNNRNGDGFSAYWLQKNSQTFEKLAKAYRHHLNKDPAQSYGVVKFAFYNPQMGRTELLTGYNANKAAAERNGGLIADEEIDELMKQAGEFPVSMSCRVPYDVCSICDNKARTRKDYCKSASEGGKCPGFGCYTGLTRVLKSGQIQFVDNPDPQFFDISKVRKPADRNAYAGRATYLLQKAATGETVSGAELAELYGMLPGSGETVSPGAWHQWQTLQKMAAYDADLQKGHSLKDRQAARGVISREKIDLTPLGYVGQKAAAEALAALAEQQVALPLGEFLRWLGNGSTKSAEICDAVASRLPGACQRLLAGGIEELAGNPFQPAVTPVSPGLRRWAAKCADDHSLSSTSVFRRAASSAIKEQPLPQLRSESTMTEKWASCSNELDGLARSYVLYKLAFVAAQPAAELPLTALFAVRQNYAY